VMKLRENWFKQETKYYNCDHVLEFWRPLAVWISPPKQQSVMTVTAKL
jgi:hypothetical protein